MKKPLPFLALFFIFLGGLSFLFIQPVLFQEEKPLSIWKAIFLINTGSHDFVVISENPKRILSKTKQGDAFLLEYMKKRKWTFEEQMGAGYLFSKNTDSLMIISTQYTRKYTIWTFKEKKKS